MFSFIYRCPHNLFFDAFRLSDFAGCITAVVLVRAWATDTAKLLSFRDSITSDPAFSAQRRTLIFHLAVATDAAYPVNALRNIALDQVSTSHVCVFSARVPVFAHSSPGVSR